MLYFLFWNSFFIFYYHIILSIFNKLKQYSILYLLQRVLCIVLQLPSCRENSSNGYREDR